MSTALAAKILAQLAQRPSSPAGLVAYAVSAMELVERCAGLSGAEKSATVVLVLQGLVEQSTWDSEEKSAATVLIAAMPAVAAVVCRASKGFVALNGTCRGCAGKCCTVS